MAFYEGEDINIFGAEIRFTDEPSVTTAIFDEDSPIAIDDAVAVGIPTLGDENGGNFGSEEVMAQADLGEDLADGSGPWWGDEDLADSGGIPVSADNLAERVPGWMADDVDGFATNMPGDQNGGFSPDEELATYRWGDGEEYGFDSEEPMDPTYVDDLASGQADRWDFEQQIEGEPYGPNFDALFWGL